MAETEDQIKRRIEADWEAIQQLAEIPGSAPLKPVPSKSERLAVTPGSKNPEYERLKKKYGDRW